MKFASPVGNSDVPYPYAVDRNGSYYLLIEGVVLHRVPPSSDPYDWYYRSENMGSMRAGGRPSQDPVVETEFTQ